MLSSSIHTLVLKENQVHYLVRISIMKSLKNMVSSSGFPFFVLNCAAEHEGGSTVDDLVPADIFICSSMRDIDFITRYVTYHCYQM